jgi:hypothetical protein
MITQPNARIEARSAAPDVQHGPLIHLLRRSHLRPAPLETRATSIQSPNIALAVCWLPGTSVRKTRRFLRTDVPGSQRKEF